ncbi:MAG: leucine-rich repeat domain-containing protein [Clostridia bacterium]|nr:leucine-rich repeat domain-containing protein [Clostridia bacterium]
MTYKIPAGFDVLSCGLDFEESGKGYVVSGIGVCKASRISIPSSFKGKPVIGIADGAFKYCDHLADVAIPWSVTSVSAFAFYGCSALAKVTLPALKSLGNHAFGNCNALTSVDFLGDEDKWAKLGKGTGNEALNSAKKTFLDMKPGAVVKEEPKPSVPTKETPAADAAKPSARQNPAQRKSHAPQDTSQREQPSVPVSDEEKGGMVFAEIEDDYVLKSMGKCRDTEVVIPSVYNGGNVVGIDAAAFEGRKFVRSVKIPCGVTYIGAGAFRACTSLVHVDIPDSVWLIGSGAFCKCEFLESVDIPKSVTTICDVAFLGCDRLLAVNYQGTEDDWKKVSVIGNNDKLLEALKFVGAGDTEKKEVPPAAGADFSAGLEFSFFGKTCSVKNAGKCEDEVVIIPPEADGRPVAGIESEAFSGRDGIRAVSIPYGVTYIGSKAFANCTSLAFVNIPETVLGMRNGAFSGCTGLVTVTIPKSVTTIGAGVFDGCTGLREINYLGSREDWEKIKLGRFDRTDALKFLGR